MKKSSFVVWIPYGVALMTIALALVLTSWLWTFLAPSRFLLLLTAVIVTVWYGGRGPGLLATGVGMGGGVYYLTSPHYMVAFEEIADIFALLLFGLIGLLISLWVKNGQAKHTLTREREALLRLLVDTNLLGVFFADAVGHITYGNPIFLNLLGYTEADLATQTVSCEQMTPPEYYARDAQALQELFNNQVCTPYEKEYIRKDGRRVPMLTGTALVTGSPEYVVGFVLDLSQQKHDQAECSRRYSEVQAALNHQEEALALLDALQTNTPIGLAFWDRELRFMRVNPAFARMNNRSSEEYLGRTLAEVQPHLAQVVEPLLQQVLATGATILDRELEGEAESDQPRHWQVSYYPVYTREQQLWGVGAVMTEVTQQKQAQDLLWRVKGNLEHRVRKRMHTTHAALQSQITEQERVVGELALREEALRHSEQMLSLHLQQTPLAVIEWDVRFRVSQWNPAAERIFGYTQAEALGMHPTDFVPQEYRSQMQMVCERHLQGQGGQSRTIVNCTRDGRLIYCEWYNTPLVDRNNQVIGVASLVLDITERREAEERLRDEKEFSERLIDSSIDGIIAFDQECRYTAWSAGMERITGLSKEQVLGRVATEVFPFLKEIGEDRHYQAVLCGAQIRTEDRPFTVPATGRSGFFQGYYSPFYGAQGRVIGGLAVIRDITERVRDEALRTRMEEERMQLVREQSALAVAECARREAEAAQGRAAFLAEASDVLAASFDQETRLEAVAHLVVPYLADWCLIDLIEADGGFRRLSIVHPRPEQVHRAWSLTGPHAPTISHGPVRVLTTGRPELIPHVDDALLQAMARDEVHRMALQGLDLHSYMCLPMKIRGRTLGAITFATGASGRVYSAVEFALAEDLTRRAAVALDNARLYRTAQQASMMKDEFLATISHELRTPLNAILGWARLLRTRRLDEETVARALETIERNARAQAQLIEDLLDVSGIVTGKIRLNVHPVALPPIIEAAIDAVRPMAEARGVQLMTNCSSRSHLVMGDSDRLQQVVWNLLSNAIKFTSSGGAVQVTLVLSTSTAQVQVVDTGQGIHPEFLPHVFERFRQADGTTSRTYGGLGLGLAIVRHLVELHGGTVLAHSEGEGKGATFTVSLPLLSA
ncbi:PAS domain S-box protein [Anthocerotibacter panamensis]|uniref:PAS domain S-box protein n=1 Tax=Anthocerotibacter panamensis TaxID=2857077 RepID=UPI001C401723|nr:PAS domain S-box protein [Anthocerotibacter panamensis]